MLLSQELGKFPIATHRLLRHAWARPLHQHKIILVDRSRWHLWRMRLVGTGLLVYQEQLIWGSVIIPAYYSISCVGSPLNSHLWTQQARLCCPVHVALLCGWGLGRQQKTDRAKY